eukprot:1158063-Pelagomonas_calceolata.AAC.8
MDSAELSWTSYGAHRALAVLKKNTELTLPCLPLCVSLCTRLIILAKANQSNPLSKAAEAGKVAQKTRGMLCTNTKGALDEQLALLCNVGWCHQGPHTMSLKLGWVPHIGPGWRQEWQRYGAGPGRVPPGGTLQQPCQQHSGPAAATAAAQQQLPGNSSSHQQSPRPQGGPPSSRDPGLGTHAGAQQPAAGDPSVSPEPPGPGTAAAAAAAAATTGGGAAFAPGGAAPNNSGSSSRGVGSSGSNSQGGGSAKKGKKPPPAASAASVNLMRSLFSRPHQVSTV